MKTRERLYALLEVKRKLTVYEKSLMWMIGNVSHGDFIHHLIELRDAGLIMEENNGDAIINRERSITDDGIRYLLKIKKLYVKNLVIKCLKWFALTLLTSFVLYSASLMWKYLLGD